MDLFDKMKKGISEAGSKAKVIVDTSRLDLQVGQKQKEIEQLYTKIGEITFKAVQDNNLSTLEADIQGFCQEIIQKQQEISELEQTISEMKSNKNCPCGQSVPVDTKFCPACGHKFDD